MSNFWERTKEFINQKKSDKHFLMIFGVSFFMILVVVFWVANLKYILVASQRTESAQGEDVSFEEVKQEFDKTFERLSKRLVQIDDARASQTAASESLKENMGDLIGSVGKSKLVATSTDSVPAADILIIPMASSSKSKTVND